MAEEQADTPASDFTGLDTPIGESRPESELRRPGSDLMGRRESTGELDGLEDHLFDVQLTQVYRFNSRSLPNAREAFTDKQFKYFFAVKGKKTFNEKEEKKNPKTCMVKIF